MIIYFQTHTMNTNQNRRLGACLKWCQAGCLTVILVFGSLALGAQDSSPQNAKNAASKVPKPAAADVTDLSGKPVDPFAGEAKATVMIFLSPECPISNRYAPTIQRMAKTFEPRGSRFWLVYPDPDLSAEKIKEHLKEYGYSLRALQDPLHRLVHKAKARVTPEAAVFSKDGTLVYHGRIDNRYVDFGKERPAATERDLERAIEATMAGKRVNRESLKAIGCYIPE